MPNPPDFALAPLRRYRRDLLAPTPDDDQLTTLAKELTQFSLPDIGEAFGGRDHTTVLHACRKITELRESDSVLHRDFVTLQQILRN